MEKLNFFYIFHLLFDDRLQIVLIVFSCDINNVHLISWSLIKNRLRGLKRQFCSEYLCAHFNEFCQIT